MKQKIEGKIVTCTPVVQFAKKDGSTGVKCLMHVRAEGEQSYPQEVAVTATGNLTRFASCVGQKVVVEYIVRVFQFVRDGIQCLGNDIYATDISNSDQ